MARLFMAYTSSRNWKEGNSNYEFKELRSPTTYTRSYSSNIRLKHDVKEIYIIQHTAITERAISHGILYLVNV